jgi:hypothetical protein
VLLKLASNRAEAFARIAASRCHDGNGGRRNQCTLDRGDTGLVPQEFGTPREHRAFSFGFDPGQIAPDNINPTLRAVARDRAIAEVQPRAYYNLLTESV